MLTVAAGMWRIVGSAKVQFADDSMNCKVAVLLQESIPHFEWGIYGGSRKGECVIKYFLNHLDKSAYKLDYCITPE